MPVFGRSFCKSYERTHGTARLARKRRGVSSLSQQPHPPQPPQAPGRLADGMPSGQPLPLLLVRLSLPFTPFGQTPLILHQVKEFARRGTNSALSYETRKS